MMYKNYQKKALIQELQKASKKNDAALWKRLADELSRPTRAMRRVNVAKLGSYAASGITLVVPGKVLATGVLDKQVDVAAFSWSDAAAEKIRMAKGKIITVAELLKSNPKANKVKIIG
jgi:large subunit ribosomal protein L18e